MVTIFVSCTSFLCLISLALTTSDYYDECSTDGPFRIISGNNGYIEGFVTHGVNNFNGDAIVNLVDDGFGFIFQDAPYEQQVLNVDGDNAILPDATTDRDELLSTGRDFTDWFVGLGFPITPNEDLFNIPYLDIGVTTAASTVLMIDLI